MKQYKVEPTYKKSVIEYDVYEKVLEDGTKLRATLEIGWRWGEFTITVPESESELLDWAHDRMGVADTYFSSVTEVFEDYGVETFEDMKEYFLPSPPADFHEMDDYDYEMDSTWDGCWEDWSIIVIGENKDEYDTEEIKEEIEEGWAEDSWDYMDSNDWEPVECTYDIHCPVTVEEIKPELGD